MYRGNQLVTYLSKCTHLTALLAFFFVSQSASASATATVTWETPDQRENGDYLNANEIGGFELAYRLTSEPVYSSVIVEQATATHYELTNLTDGEYEFKIAAFDADGLYSDFSDSTIALISSTTSGNTDSNSGDSSNGTGTDSSTGGDSSTDLVDAVVSWQIPSERENGEALALVDIGGYEIAYRSTDLSVFQSVVVNSAELTEYQLTNLHAGEYEFTIAAFDRDGLYSDFSEPTIVVLGADGSTSGGSGGANDTNTDTSTDTDSTDTNTESNGSNDTASGTGSNSGSETGENETTETGNLYSATVTWETPAERENGEFLSYADIGGYEIAYRLTQSNTFQSLVVDDSLQTQMVLNNLVAGEYEFSIAAFDSEGLYSDFSEPTYAVIGAGAGSTDSENAGSENSSSENSGSESTGSTNTGSENTNSGSETGSNLVAATIRWQVPSERENGALLAIEELGGYEIAYRNTNDPVFEAIIVTNREQTAYELANLVAGEYEFSIAAFDNEGLYSDFSEPTIVVLGGGSTSVDGGDDVANNDSGNTGTNTGTGGDSQNESNTGNTDNTSESNTNGQLLSATINWLIPTHRENGEQLLNGEIGGFEVAYRNTQSGTYTSLIVEDATQASLEITNLEAGEYEFIIAAFDSEGLYSDFSDPTIATIGADGSVASSSNDNNTDVANSGDNTSGTAGNGTDSGTSTGTGGSDTEQTGSAQLVATISWEIPTQRENGQDLLLSEIGGYEILYRPTLSAVYESIVVEDQTQTQIVLNNLPSGEYEFVIAAFDSDGLYSDFSDPTIAMLGEQ